LGLHRGGHAVRIAWDDPEGLLTERRHRRHETFAGKVEIMGESALGHEETDELLGGGGVDSGLEDNGGNDGAHDRKGLATGAASNPAARALFHLDMLARGFYLARRGFISLSLPLTAADHNAIAGPSRTS
jgi:hypothetical protein